MNELLLIVSIAGSRVALPAAAVESVVELEALIPSTFEGRGPETLDSGRNCTAENLGVLADAGITEVRYAGGAWDFGGNRAAALWMIRRVLREGWQIGLAAAEADKAGLKSEIMRDFAFSYIQRHAMAQAAAR